MRRKIVWILLAGLVLTAGCGQTGETIKLSDKTVIGDGGDEFVDAELEEKSEDVEEKKTEAATESEKEPETEEATEPETESETEEATEPETESETEEATEPEKTLEQYRNYCSTQYEYIISDTVTDTGFGEYYLCDMNNDGLEDLIVGWGESEADYTNTVYMLMESNDVEPIGSFYGYSMLYGAQDGNGVEAVTNRMGTLRVRKISLNSSATAINEETILEHSELDGDSGYNNANELPYSDCNDFSLLETMR